MTQSREAQARRGEEAEVDPEQFQDPDNEYGLFAGTTYEQDDEEADRIYEKVDEAMDARRKARRFVLGQFTLSGTVQVYPFYLGRLRNSSNSQDTAPSAPRFNSSLPI